MYSSVISFLSAASRNVKLSKSTVFVFVVPVAARVYSLVPAVVVKVLLTTVKGHSVSAFIISSIARLT